MTNSKFYLKSTACHGGSLRNHRIKRCSRRLSNSKFHHITFKVNKNVCHSSLREPRIKSICRHVVRSYAKRFKVKIADFSIQNDHIHLMVRTFRKSNYLSFFRVVAGQIAQRVTDTFHEVKFEESFWKYRPFSRIVRSRLAYYKTKAYIRLNELEALGIIPYQKKRLKFSTPTMWKLFKVDPLLAGWRFYGNFKNRLIA